MSLLQNEFPKFEGSTGGWLSSATKEEIYAISWTSPTASLFELPTGGTAEMNTGSNLAYFARKEQCLALGSQLRKFKITNYRIFRIYPGKNTEIDTFISNLKDIDTQIDTSKSEAVINLIHPYDGVFPEKVNEGRLGVNQIFHSEIGTADISDYVTKEQKGEKVTPSNYLTLYFNYNLDKTSKEDKVKPADVYETFSKDPWAVLSDYNPDLLVSLKDDIK